MGGVIFFSGPRFFVQQETPVPENRGRPWPREWVGPAPKAWEG